MFNSTHSCANPNQKFNEHLKHLSMRNQTCGMTRETHLTPPLHAPRLNSPLPTGDNSNRPGSQTRHLHPQVQTHQCAQFAPASLEAIAGIIRCTRRSSTTVSIRLALCARGALTACTSSRDDLPVADACASSAPTRSSTDHWHPAAR